MVVTDLHGDWDAYQRYRDRFVKLQARNSVDCLVFTGDLIHSSLSGQPDNSIQIVLDVLALQAIYGSAVIYLCGNHEMPHIYSVGLAKGDKDYTPAFEAALSQCGRRTEVTDLFDTLPFYIRTPAGVSLAHAGAPALMADPKKALKILNWSHQDLLSWAQKSVAGADVDAMRCAYARLNRAESYEALARHYIAIAGPDDPRYDHLLRGFLATTAPEFDLLWSALFTRCEEEYGADYAIFLDAMLKELSVGFVPQRFLVSGHMNTPNGHRVFDRVQLRLASAWHARPRDAGQYLRFDVTQSIRSVEDILTRLESVF
jgi:hypothetical protein